MKSETSRHQLDTKPTPTGSKQHKPTKEKYNERIEYVRSLLAMGVRKADIKLALKTSYGVGHRTTENYLARARERNLRETGKPRDEHVADAYSFYNRLIEKSPSDLVKLKARTRIDKLLGLEAPKRHEVSGPDAGPIETSVTVREAMKGLTDEELRTLKRVKDRMADLTSGAKQANN